VELPNVVDSASFNLCVGKQSSFAGLLPQFDETMKAMKKAGVLQKIYDKYR